MDRRQKPKLPKKLAMLSVPLAVASPLLAELPATASDSSEVQKNSDSSPLAPSAKTTELASAVPEVRVAKPATSYRVKSGDTVTQIAKRFGVSVSKIARLNNLGPKSLIRVGQLLQLAGEPVKTTEVESYRVKPGDTLSAIAKKHALSLSEITALNRINASTIIYPGQVLRVARLIQAPEVSTNTPSSYQVLAGDTLESISKKFKISLSSLREFNALSKSSIIYVGQLLQLQKPRKAPRPAEPIPSASVLSDEISSVDPMRPTGICTVHGFHIVSAGETVSKIAAVYGVSTQSVLSENGLSWSSTIYVGQRLAIPGSHEIKNCPSITSLNQEMKSNAEVIYRVGKSLGVSNFGIVIALATAMQESSLKNIDFGDRDSIGLFQQRPSQGWGTVTEIMNPEYSARAFFGGPQGPNFKRVKGLLDIQNWSGMTLTQAAQAVQVSAFPDAYQKWELSAWSWLDLLDAGI